jgi:hypothetical protein
LGIVVASNSAVDSPFSISPNQNDLLSRGISPHAAFAASTATKAFATLACSCISHVGNRLHGVCVCYAKLQ